MRFINVFLTVIPIFNLASGFSCGKIEGPGMGHFQLTLDNTNECLQSDGSQVSLGDCNNDPQWMVYYPSNSIHWDNQDSDPPCLGKDSNDNLIMVQPDSCTWFTVSCVVINGVEINLFTLSDGNALCVSGNRNSPLVSFTTCQSGDSSQLWH